MARDEYYRVDLNVQLRSTEDGGANVRTGIASWFGDAGPAGDVVVPILRHLTPESVHRWLELGTLPPQAAGELGIEALLAPWQLTAFPIPASRIPSPPQSLIELRRIALEIDDLDLASVAWERGLAEGLGGRSFSPTGPLIVRETPILPSNADAALTLPIRLLQVDPSFDFRLARLVRELFWRPASAIASAVQVEECALENVERWREQLHWPTAEVLHFDRFDKLQQWARGFGQEQRCLLSTADPTAVGNLGWLLRLAQTWQTRLIVIQCNDWRSAGLARRFGAAIAARGGPAVLVCDFPADGPQDFFSLFYEKLIHDSPLDECLAATHPLGDDGYATLFAGAGREEALRVSAPGAGLATIAERLDLGPAAPPRGAIAIRPEADPQRLAYEFRTILGRHATPAPLEDPLSKEGLFRDKLRMLRQDWSTWQFDLHESDGLLPLAVRLQEVRAAAGVHRAASRLELIPPTAGGPTEARFVNAWLCGRDSDGLLKRLAPPETKLTAGHTYHLQIQLGPRDEFIQIIGATAFLEEVFKWTPDMAGAWVEVGVSGLDFEICGGGGSLGAVRELWLPRQGPSDSISFAVVPRRSPVSRLRFCLYYQGNLIQSFKLAAITEPVAGAGFTLPPGGRRALLAQALDYPDTGKSDVPNGGYLARLEYSMTASADGLFSCPSRTMSIVANNLDGTPVITVKAADIFEQTPVQADANLPDHVNDLRATLDSIATSRDPNHPEDRSLWTYAFREGGIANQGTPEKLKDALMRLAEKGWQLYTQVLPKRARQGMEQVLREGGQTIHVAHLLLEKVIPWAAVYDRYYDAGRQDAFGHPAPHEACLAPLPGPNGEAGATDCGKHPDCPLHPENQRRRLEAGQPELTEHTIACPLHFWGFRHVIEVPLQQVPPEGEARQHASTVRSSRPVALAAGISASLPTAKAHLQQLRQLAQRLSGDVRLTSQAARDAVLLSLRDTGLDVVYLYCHARGRDEGIFPPCLEFQDTTSGAVPGRIGTADLDALEFWTHGPLVVLNGCGTVGFRPDAISPFATKLRDLGASGVIGTEIPVDAELAAGFAEELLDRFLSGQRAGDALLAARLSLLGKYNPLGLAYTLYAVAELSLASPARSPAPVPAAPAAGAP